MPIHRAYFKTKELALEGAAHGLERVKADMLAASKLAGVSPPSLAPITQVSIDAVEALPAGAGLPGYSHATLKLTSHDGRTERVETYQPTANVEASVSPASGSVTATSSNKSTARVVARIAEYVELNVAPGAETVLQGPHALPAAALNVTSTAGFPASGQVDLGGFGIVSYTGVTATTFTGCTGGTGSPGTGVRVAEAISIPTTARFQDPQSSKFYEPDAATKLGPGRQELKVKESFSSQAGDLTYGSTLDVLSTGLSARDFARIVGPAVVIDMKAASVPAASPMKDMATGKAYQTGTLVTLTSAGRAKSGELAAEVEFVRVADSVADAASAAFGTALGFDPAAPAGIAQTAQVSFVGGGTVPTGTLLRRSDGKLYQATVDTTIPDSLTGVVAVVAQARGGGSDLAIGGTLTFVGSPPSGLDAAATVASATPWGAYPEGFPAQPIGAPLRWASAVQPSPDGRWLAVVYTQPYGS